MAIRVSLPAALMVAALALSGCGGGSASNPFGSLGSLGSLNPFGGGGSSDGGGGAARPSIEDTTVLIEAIEEVRPEAALRGVILRATVIAATDGYHTAQFVGRNEALPDENGIVTYEIRAVPPESPGFAGPLSTRRIVIATFIPDSDLDNIRGFRIVSRTRTVDIRR